MSVRRDVRTRCGKQSTVCRSLAQGRIKDESEIRAAPPRRVGLRRGRGCGFHGQSAVTSAGASFSSSSSSVAAAAAASCRTIHGQNAVAGSGMSAVRPWLQPPSASYSSHPSRVDQEAAEAAEVAAALAAVEEFEKRKHSASRANALLAQARAAEAKAAEAVAAE